jgi:polyhydroxybutyrate depolymerase
MDLSRFLRKFIRIITFTLLIMVTCMCAPARPQSTDEDSLELDGLRRTYQLFLPSSYDGTRAVPLVMVLHGGMGNGEGISNVTAFSTVAEREGFIVVYPNGYQESWADGRGTTAADEAGVDDVAFISRLIEKLSTDYRIVYEQVYVTGFSNGGHMSYRLACELSEKIAAVAPVAASLSENLAASCSPQRPVPVLQIHGTADPIRPYEGGEARGMVLSAPASVAFWASKNGCSSEPSSTNLPDIAQDGTTVTLTAYTNCQQGGDVQHYIVVEGGHTWPGGLQYLPERRIGKTSQDINASEVIWKFFAEHSLR